MKIHKVLKIDVDEKIDVNGDEMTIYETARWLSLIRGIETIDKKAQQLKICLDKEKNWVKPLALQRFIDEDTAANIAEVKTLWDKEKAKNKCTTG